VRVTRDYVAQYPDPITVRAGDRVSVGKDDPEFPGWRWCTGPDQRGGWVPDQLLHRDGSDVRMLRDYTARELSVRAGSEVVIHDRMAGWLWVGDADGNEGWIPDSCLGSE
jgi:SH3-like domain-containing protein